MKIFLIRHAEPDYSVDGLTPKGKIEAALLARRMARYPIRDFYVSPLGRARATAEATLRVMDREAEILPWLAEFRGRAVDPDTGKERICWDYAPRFWARRPALQSVDTWTQDEMYQGSNVPAVWKETTEGVDSLLGKYGFVRDGAVWKSKGNTQDAIACYCHFGIAMAILGYLTDVSPVVLWQHFIMAPSAVTEIVSEERVNGEVIWRCAKLGDLTHLEAAGEPWSTAGMYPEIYTGVDSTDPAVNGTLDLQI